MGRQRIRLHFWPTPNGLKILIMLEECALRYSIDDMAIWPWARGWEGQEQDIREFPTMAAWLDRVGGRPGVVRGTALGKDRR